MNKLEGKYNKEERGEGFFSAMFSKQSSYDTFHCNDVKSSNEQTTAQEEVIDMQDLAPEDDKMNYFFLLIRIQLNIMSILTIK
ncbi:MAG: hypothetical protein UH687_02185 [Bacteroidaceae bacterium]|nr:hypothetical protein [Bacteroidaceae bacterium]